VAAVRPQRLPELESIKGLGPAKIGRYGEELLEIVAQTQSAPSPKTT
jgi:superfamily II DNA helicase RecQ